MKNIKASIICFLLLAMSIPGCFEVKDEDLIKDYASTTKNKTVGIGNGGVTMPLGYYALFRKGNSVCAIIFTECGKNKQEEGFVWDRMYYNYSIYEWYFTENDDFKGKNIKRGGGKLTLTQIPLLGTPGLIFETSDIECGKIKINAGPCAALSLGFEDIFKVTPEEIDQKGLEAAPTKWKEINEVNLKDKRLKWYKADPNREWDREIPVDELW